MFLMNPVVFNQFLIVIFILINKDANEAEFNSESLVICSLMIIYVRKEKKNLFQVSVICFSFCCDHLDRNALFLPPEGAKVPQTSQ